MEFNIHKETDPNEIKACNIVAHIINNVNKKKKENTTYHYKKAEVAKNIYEMLVKSTLYSKVADKEFVNGMTIEIVCNSDFEDGRIRMIPEETPIIDFTLIEEKTNV